MLSHKILSCQNTAKIASYYEDSADDYYTKEKGSSEWQGKGAKLLKLKGAVEKEIFRKLLEGSTDLTGKYSHSNPDPNSTRSSTRYDSHQRIGIDFTFSAPKSLSIQALIGRDKNIITAHDKAVKRALEIAEHMAEARKKVGGKTSVERTKNLTIAKFRHETSREHDPQLHTHCVIMNLTLRIDGKWCALRNDEIIKMTKYLGAVYRSELAINLQKMGYDLRYEGKGFFELAHITKEQIDGFSKRSQQVEELLANQGLNRSTATTEQKQLAALKSRNAKIQISREEIMREWQNLSTTLGINFDYKTEGYESKLESSKATISALTKAAKLEAAKRAVRFAINHLSERSAVMSKSNLLDIAVKHSVGATLLPDIKREINYQVKKGYIIKEDALYKSSTPPDKNKHDQKQNQKQPLSHNQAQTKEAWVAELVATKGTKSMSKTKARSYVAKAIKQGRLTKIEARYTTKTALKRESSILQIESQGRNSLKPIMQKELAQTQLESTNLNLGQREAALLMLTSENRIVGVQGFAGTGKSHMLKTAKQMIEDNGYQIQALAPYGSQVKALSHLGIESRTLESFLRNPDKDIDKNKDKNTEKEKTKDTDKNKDKSINDKTVIVIDEAGVISTRQMEQTLKLIEKTNARVILLGDISQTKAIEAGKPFEQLQTHGMATAKMEEIERQKQPTLKEAVELAAKGDTAASLKLLKDIDIKTITEIKDQKQRLNELADYYARLPKDEREATIAVSGTNESRRYINEQIRERLKSAGQIGNMDKQERVFELLTNRDMNKEDKKIAKYYQLGDIISPEQDYTEIGLQRGELYRVEKSSQSHSQGNSLTVKSKDQKLITFNPLNHNKLSVYQHENKELTIGDTVRITRNNPEHNLANGDRMLVKEVQGDHIVLTRIGEPKETAKNKSQISDVILSTSKPLHLDYAYATTVHSSQGLTSSRTLIDLDTKSPTASKDLYYVAISRAKQEVRIYTNSIDDLPKAISRDRTKSAALEMPTKAKPEIQKSELKKPEMQKPELAREYER